MRKANGGMSASRQLYFILHPSSFILCFPFRLSTAFAILARTGVICSEEGAVAVRADVVLAARLAGETPALPGERRIGRVPGEPSVARVRKWPSGAGCIRELFCVLSLTGMPATFRLASVAMRSTEGGTTHADGNRFSPS
jgi:hypothetical protein